MATILVIEDEPLVRRTLVRILARNGHEVIEAKDGREGLKRFNEQRPDIVITDVYMPDKEGIETICELHHDAPHLPIVVMSGGAGGSGSALNVAMKLGASASLSKPFRPEELLSIVKRFCPAA